MKTAVRLFVICILYVTLCFAQAPAGAPAGATGLCKDGTYYTGANKQGACRGHKGVKEWWGAAAAAPAAKTPASSAVTTAPAPAAKAAPGSMSAPAPGTGADQVWVNTASNVYHCPGTRYYGKTKAGAYMSESEAIAKGARPERGKACK